MGPKHEFATALSESSRELLTEILDSELDTSDFDTNQVEVIFLNEDYHTLFNALQDCLSFYDYRDIVLHYEELENKQKTNKLPLNHNGIKDVSTNSDRSVLYDPQTMTMIVHVKGTQITVGLMDDKFEPKKVGRFGVLVKTNDFEVGISVPSANGKVILRKQKRK